MEYTTGGYIQDGAGSRWDINYAPPGELSNWACAALLHYNRELSLEEIKLVWCADRSRPGASDQHSVALRLVLRLQVDQEPQLIMQQGQQGRTVRLGCRRKSTHRRCCRRPAAASQLRHPGSVRAAAALSGAK